MRVYLDLSVPRAFRSKRITCVETFTERIIHCVYVGSCCFVCTCSFIFSTHGFYYMRV